jgi:hypothetical protein
MCQELIFSLKRLRVLLYCRYNTENKSVLGRRVVQCYSLVKNTSQ